MKTNLLQKAVSMALLTLAVSACDSRKTGFDYGFNGEQAVSFEPLVLDQNEKQGNVEIDLLAGANSGSKTNFVITFEHLPELTTFTDANGNPAPSVPIPTGIIRYQKNTLFLNTDNFPVNEGESATYHFTYSINNGAPRGLVDEIDFESMIKEDILDLTNFKESTRMTAEEQAALDLDNMSKEDIFALSELSDEDQALLLAQPELALPRNKILEPLAKRAFTLNIKGIHENVSTFDIDANTEKEYKLPPNDSGTITASIAPFTADDKNIRFTLSNIDGEVYPDGVTVEDEAGNNLLDDQNHYIESGRFIVKTGGTLGKVKLTVTPVDQENLAKELMIDVTDQFTYPTRVEVVNPQQNKVQEILIPECSAYPLTALLQPLFKNFTNEVTWQLGDTSHPTLNGLTLNSENNRLEHSAINKLIDNDNPVSEGVTLTASIAADVGTEQGLSTQIMVKVVDNKACHPELTKNSFNSNFDFAQLGDITETYWTTNKKMWYPSGTASPKLGSAPSLAEIKSDIGVFDNGLHIQGSVTDQADIGLFYFEWGNKSRVAPIEETVYGNLPNARFIVSFWIKNNDTTSLSMKNYFLARNNPPVNGLTYFPVDDGTKVNDIDYVERTIAIDVNNNEWQLIEFEIPGLKVNENAKYEMVFEGAPENVDVYIDNFSIYQL